MGGVVRKAVHCGSILAEQQYNTGESVSECKQKGSLMMA